MKKKMLLVSGLVLTGALYCVMAQAQEEEAAVESTAPTAEVEQTGSAESAPATGSVARATFTTGVQDREPVDQLNTADTNLGTVFFFTELTDLQNQTVTHRWEYNGENMAEVKFNVGGARWRVHSSKKMLPEWTGTWTVSVVNGAGQVLTSETLNYTAAPAAAEEPAAAPAEAAADASDE